MPELPEVETIKKGLQSSILNNQIERVEVRLPKIVSIGPSTVSNIRKNSKKVSHKFEVLLQKQKFVGVKRRGKILILELSHSMSLLVHLKMAGQLIYARKEQLPKKVRVFNKPKFPLLELPHKYTHVIFYFKNGDRLYYNDLRQFGYLKLVKGSELTDIKELREFGPESFDKAFSLEYLFEVLKKRNTSIKQVLMDPKVVTGIGNIYSDEILMCAGVRPQKKSSLISEKEAGRIIKCIPKILNRALKLQGSSVGDFFKLDGSEGKFGQEHRVYGRAGKKCLKCGSIIKKIKLGGRTSCYCPLCQK